jgi:Holliday junction DNA helicase RuvA
MISYVKGTVAYIGNDCIVVDNNGIGYNIQVSSSTASAVVMEKEVQIYTYMNVKENELSLFGFLTKEELNMFNLLISVNGVGPKSAVAMLGALSPSQLALAIATEDIKALSVGQGIGKKIAQRIALELKDKVGADTITTGVELVQKVDVTTGERAEALSALMALGFTKNEAENAIKAVFVNGMATEEIISKALKVVK